MADWNRNFKSVTFYGGRDTLWTDAAVIEASQNTKIDCGVISRPYAQTFTVIVDAVEGEPAALPTATARPPSQLIVNQLKKLNSASKTQLF